mgnify:CR=1 FL=1
MIAPQNGADRLEPRKMKEKASPKSRSSRPVSSARPGASRVKPMKPNAAVA